MYDIIFDMKTFYKSILFIFLVFPFWGDAELLVGIGTTSIAPPVGSPSAGYAERKQGMEGVNDPLLAQALFIDNGSKKIVLCSVDHLGFTSEMVQSIIHKVKHHPQFFDCEIYIASSHTHSGGGGYLDIPVIGEWLAGQYDANLRNFYEDKTAEAIILASQNLESVLMGIGYGHARSKLSFYRGKWPLDVEPLSDVAVFKFTKIDGTPYALLFNFPMHPTVLNSENKLFSADFVGYARKAIQNDLGSSIPVLYFNGAQGDVLPCIYKEDNRFQSCHMLGILLGRTVKNIWDKTETDNMINIEYQKESYQFIPQATPQGLKLPLEKYDSELNVLILNQKYAFVTIPGEMSCLYDKRLKEFGQKLGFEQLSIFGLVNDAHGYIILPESWRHKTMESSLSFGGEEYGDLIEEKVKKLLQNNNN